MDAQIDGFIVGLTSRVKRQLNRDIEATIYTEYYSVNNCVAFYLNQFPVISVTSLWSDPQGFFGQASNAFASATQLVQGVDWVLESGFNGVGSAGLIRRINGGFYQYPSRQYGKVARQPPINNGNVKVVYTAGYAVVPADIQMTVNMAVMRMIAMSASGLPAQSNSYEDAAESYFSPDVFASIFGSIENNLAAYTMPVI